MFSSGLYYLIFNKLQHSTLKHIVCRYETFKEWLIKEIFNKCGMVFNVIKKASFGKETYRINFSTLNRNLKYAI